MRDREIKRYFLIILAIFLLSVINGYFVAEQNPELARQTVEQTKSEFGFIKDLKPFLIFLFIFFNNSIKAFLVIIGGVLFGVIPLVFMLVNGEIFGVIMNLAVKQEGWLTVILGLAPHGIFEIPAIVLASSCGLWIGYKFYRKIRHNEPLGEAVRQSFRIYIRIVIPALLIAALIETYITPVIMQAME